MSDKTDRLKKIQALALSGIDGEKEQAQAILSKLMKKYKVTFDELDEETLNEYIFEYHGREQEMLLKQTIYKVTDSKSSSWDLAYTHSGRKCRTQLGCCCTSAQKIEIELLFDFYKRLWDKERKALLSAFIQKHRIFGRLKPDEKPMELSPEESEKMFQLMCGLSNEYPYKQLSDKTQNERTDEK